MPKIAKPGACRLGQTSLYFGASDRSQVFPPRSLGRMRTALLILALIMVVVVPGAMGDYLKMVSWASGSTNCTALLSSSTAKVFNLNVTSDMSVCTTFSTNYNLWGQVECFSNGTAHMNFSAASSCNPADSSQPTKVMTVKPASWGEAQCWSGAETPNGLTAMSVTCVQGDIPSPSAPSTVPQQSPPTPVASTPAPVSTTPTPVSSTPTSTPVASTPAPVSSTPAPVATPVPASTPTVAPTAPVPTAAPTAYDPIVTTIMTLTTASAASCGNSVSSVNVSGEIDSPCIRLREGQYVSPGCTAGDNVPAGYDYGEKGGYPFGVTCTDSDCFDCVPWAGNGNAPATASWTIPRCIDTTAATGFSVTCTPVRQSQIPAPEAPPPVPVAPVAPVAPIAPIPIAPVPQGIVATVDWSAEFGTSCSAPMLFGSFSNSSTSCQEVYSGSVYALAYCNAQGTPSGKLCSVSSCNSDSACTAFSATASTTWGQSYCVLTSSKLAMSVSCNNHTAAPVAPAPVTPEAPAPPPVSTGGQVTLSAYMDPACKRQIQYIPLKANLSLCQQVTAVGSTLYMRVDCYYNGTIHGGVCKDSSCASCTSLPPAPSDLCVPYSGFQLVSAISVKCPIVNPPTPTPSGNASAISVNLGLILLGVIFTLALMML